MGLNLIEEYATKNNIPIMEKDGINFLTNYVKENNVRTVLEIGSAIGYSAIKMALVDKNVYVVTIEREEDRYLEAIKNIKELHLEEQIEIHLMDAFDFESDLKFDLVFIDAAKSQYTKFFEKFKTNLKTNGSIISDNLSFHGLVESNAEGESKNVQGLVRKIKKYITFLEENEEFETEFIETGDGIGISKRKETI